SSLALTRAARQLECPTRLPLYDHRRRDEEHRQFARVALEQIREWSGRGDRDVRREGGADLLALTGNLERGVHGGAHVEQLVPVRLQRLVAPLIGARREFDKVNGL